MSPKQSPNTAFKPTNTQIKSAQNVLVAMVHEQTIRPIVEAYETDILQRLQHRVAQKWVLLGVKDEVILDRKRTYLMDEQEFQIFLKETYAARDAANLKVSRPDNCPLLEAESLRISAENALLQAMSSTPGLEAFADGKVLALDLRKRAIDLMLQLLSPYVGSAQSILADYVAPPRAGS